MCDVAYAVLLEQIEQDGRAAWIATVSLAAAGAKVDETTPADRRRELEKWLDEVPGAAPEGVDAEQWALRQALGVA